MRNLEWMTPNPDYFGGWIWMGVKPVTDDDITELREYLGGEEPQLDARSLLGRWHPDWSTLYNEQVPDGVKFGGLGSETYQLQKVGRGVGFRPENDKTIFHVGPDGFTHGILDYPRTGRAFHRDDYGTIVAGPQPETPADRRLGDLKEYHWNETNQWWVARLPR